MGIISAEIITNDTQANILDRLKKITIEDQPFIKPKGIFFLGKITGSRFKLITFNSPPIEVEFTISDNKITIISDQHSLEPDLTAITYALGFPISFALFLWGMLDKHVPPGGKLSLALFMTFPYLLNKIAKYTYNSYVLPTNEVLFRKMEELLDVKIIVSPN